MTIKRCTKCNREMGYNPPSKECAPCELGYNKETDPTLTPEWFEALISTPAPPPEEAFMEYHRKRRAEEAAIEMLARKCSRCGAYKVTVESECKECKE